MPKAGGKGHGNIRGREGGKLSTKLKPAAAVRDWAGRPLSSLTGSDPIRGQ